MKWFIHPVTVFNTLGKTQKGQKLQSMALQLDNKILDGPDPITIRSLTDAIARYARELDAKTPLRRKTVVTCHYDGHSGQITAQPEGSIYEHEYFQITFNRVQCSIDLPQALNIVEGADL